MSEDIGRTLVAWWRLDDALTTLAQPQVHDLVARAPWLPKRVSRSRSTAAPSSLLGDG